MAIKHGDKYYFVQKNVNKFGSIVTLAARNNTAQLSKYIKTQKATEKEIFSLNFIGEHIFLNGIILTTIFVGCSISLTKSTTSKKFIFQIKILSSLFQFSKKYNRVVNFQYSKTLAMEIQPDVSRLVFSNN